MQCLAFQTILKQARRKCRVTASNFVFLCSEVDCVVTAPRNVSSGYALLALMSCLFSMVDTLVVCYLFVVK